MTKYICLVFLLLAGCTPSAPSAKVYAKPEVGMLNTDFDALCKPTTESADLVSVSNAASGERTTLKLVSTPARESNGCSGTFIFAGSRLESIQKT